MKLSLAGLEALLPAGRYLKTLRRVPDDIIREIAPLEIVPPAPTQCIVGHLASAVARRGLNRGFSHGPFATQMAFGGTVREWSNIFYEITHQPEQGRIMRAYQRRIREATS